MSKSPQLNAHGTAVCPPSTSTSFKRRRFLLALGAGGAGVAAAAGHAIAAPVLPDAVVAPDAESKGYRETAHVRDYYATTRI